MDVLSCRSIWSLRLQRRGGQGCFPPFQLFFTDVRGQLLLAVTAPMQRAYGCDWDRGDKNPSLCPSSPCRGTPCQGGRTPHLCMLLGRHLLGRTWLYSNVAWDRRDELGDSLRSLPKHLCVLDLACCKQSLGTCFLRGSSAQWFVVIFSKEHA